MAQSDVCPTGDQEVAGFDSFQARQNSFMEIDNEILSTVILFLWLIQEELVNFKQKSVHKYWLTA